MRAATKSAYQALDLRKPLPQIMVALPKPSEHALGCRALLGQLGGFGSGGASGAVGAEAELSGSIQLLIGVTQYNTIG